MEWWRKCCHGDRQTPGGPDPLCFRFLTTSSSFDCLLQSALAQIFEGLGYYQGRETQFSTVQTVQSYERFEFSSCSIIACQLEQQEPVNLLDPWTVSVNQSAASSLQVKFLIKLVPLDPLGVQSCCQLCEVVLQLLVHLLCVSAGAAGTSQETFPPTTYPLCLCALWVITPRPLVIRASLESATSGISMVWILSMMHV